MKKNIKFVVVFLLFIAGSAIAYYTLFIKPEFKSAASKVELSKTSGALHPTKVSHQQEMIDGLPVVRTFGDFMTVDNIDELIEKSDIVAIGKTSKSVREAIPMLPKTPDGTIYSAFSEVPLKINKIFKGDKSLKEIRVGQLAAVIQENGRSYIRAFDQYL
jgi:hypothetical protein